MSKINARDEKRLFTVSPSRLANRRPELDQSSLQQRLFMEPTFVVGVGSKQGKDLVRAFGSETTQQGNK
jgi:hypothetical protein